MYEASVRAMYWAYELAQKSGTKSDTLEAAGYADAVVDGANLYNRNEGGFLVSVTTGRAVSLKQAERDAYALLKHRAEIAPANRFFDSGARWFL
jgi:hypothetical protein